MNKHKKGSRFLLLAAVMLVLGMMLGACGTDSPTGGAVQTKAGVVTVGTPTAGLKACKACHPQTTAAWEGTRHANLNSDPSFTTSAFCSGCHNRTGDSQFTSPVRMIVGCEACHSGGQMHADAGGVGPIGNTVYTATVVSGTVSTLAVSGQFLTCTGCHELLDLGGDPASTTTSTIATHSTNTPITVANVITDTHFAVPPASYGSITTPVRGYALVYNSETVCSDCHNPHGTVDINQEWAASAHGDRNGNTFGYFSAAWGRRNWSTSASCQSCHTTTGFIAFAKAFQEGNPAKAMLIRNGDPAYRPLASNTTWKPELLKCNGCHEDYKGALRNPGPVTIDYSETTTTLGVTYTYSVASFAYPNVDKSNVCMACHTGREIGDTIKNLSLTTAPTITTFRNFSFINSHYLTGGATVFGASGYEFDGRSYEDPSTFQHNQIGMNDFRSTGTSGPCVGCHMSRPSGNGDHLFLPVTRLNYARYKAGTVTVTNGSAVVTGASTSWASAGIDIATDEFLGPDNRPYLIASVDSDTQITLTTPWSVSYSSPSISGPGSFYAITQTGPRIVGIASEVCYSCHAGGTSILIEQLNEERELYEGALMALEHQLDKKGFCFLESSPYFFKLRWRQGTVSVTNGSRIVNGTSTSFVSMGTSTFDRFRAYDGDQYEIQTVNSDTQITLKTPYLGQDQNGQSYAVVISGSANAVKDWDPTAAGEAVGRNNLGAAFNFNLLEHDPGAYIHNRTYVKRLLYDAFDMADDSLMNFSVGATLNALGPEPFKTKAMLYILPNGVLGIPAERP